MTVKKIILLAFLGTICLVGGCKKVHVHTAIEPTCVRPGYCSECGEVLEDALGHSFGEWEKKGNDVEERVCTRCGKTEQKEIEATEESQSENTDVEALIAQCIQGPSDLYYEGADEGSYFYYTGCVGEIIEEDEKETHVQLFMVHFITPDDEYYDEPLDLVISNDQELPSAGSIIKIYGEYMGNREHVTSHRDHESYPCMEMFYYEAGDIDDMILDQYGEGRTE